MFFIIIAEFGLLLLLIIVLMFLYQCASIIRALIADLREFGNGLSKGLLYISIGLLVVGGRAAVWIASTMIHILLAIDVYPWVAYGMLSRAIPAAIMVYGMNSMYMELKRIERDSKK